ncbi:MAG TPA: nucleoside monophosphate kinase [Acidimicrobiia bacterium]
MIVAIAGKPGSGKSTVARAVASRLGFDHVSAGDFMRQMAAERDMSVLALGRLAEQDGGAIDREIDERSRLRGVGSDNFVIDARLAWRFIPHALKVFLDVDLDVAAARIYDDHRGTEAENVDLETTRRNIEARTNSEGKRYVEYYGVDYLDPANYDVVIDTSSLDVAEVVDAVVAVVDAPDRG